MLHAVLQIVILKIRYLQIALVCRTYPKEVLIHSAPTPINKKFNFTSRMDFLFVGLSNASIVTHDAHNGKMPSSYFRIGWKNNRYELVSIYDLCNHSKPV